MQIFQLNMAVKLINSKLNDHIFQHLFAFKVAKTANIS